jgi:HAD superfamily hydrolase (TIGR01509 family)
MSILPKLILCDLDGTLVDSLGYLYTIYRIFLRKYGQEGSPEEFQELNGPPIREVVALLQQRYSLSDTYEELYRVYSDLIRHEYAVLAPLASGALSFLHRAREHGVRLMVVTSASRNITTRFLSCHQLTELFEGLVTGEDVFFGKPDPEPYLLALQQSGVPAAAAIAIEDSPSGVASASSAGLVTYWLIPGCAASDDGSQVRRIGSWQALQVHLYGAVKTG